MQLRYFYYLEQKSIEAWQNLSFVETLYNTFLLLTAILNRVQADLLLLLHVKGGGQKRNIFQVGREENTNELLKKKARERERMCLCVY